MKRTWVYSPKPAQLERFTKDILKDKVQRFIDSSERLSNKVNRIEVRAGRIYLYYLVEPFVPKGEKVRWIKPLIEGKYLEFPLARIIHCLTRKGIGVRQIGSVIQANGYLSIEAR